MNHCQGPVKILLLGVLLLGGSGLSPRPAAGEELPYFVDAAANTRAVNIGQSFHVLITAGAKRGLVHLPGGHYPLPGCQLMGYTEKDVSRKHAGYLARQGTYTLKAFVLNRVSIPALPVKIDWDNGNTETAYTAPLKVAVAGMHPEAGLHLINPRAPLPLPLTGLVLTGLALAAAAAIGLKMLAKQRHARPVRRPSAQRMALQGLRLLSHSDMNSPDYGQTYFVILSKVIRRYLSERFQVPALEWPRVTVLAALERRGLEPDTLTMIDNLLQEADLVKFAMEPVSRERIQAAHALAEQIVQQTQETITSGREGR